MGPTSERYLWGHTGGWLYGTSTFMAFDQGEDWGFMFFINTDADLTAFFTIARRVGFSFMHVCKREESRLASPVR